MANDNAAHAGNTAGADNASGTADAPRASGAGLRGPRATWLVLVAVILVAINLRPAIMGFVPVLDVVAADVGFGVAAIGLLSTVPTAVFGVTALLGPAMFRIAGGELLLMLSAVITCIGIVVRSLAGDVWLIGAAFIFAVFGMGIANVVLVPVIKQYFPRRIGEVTGLYLTLLQTGPVIGPVLAAALIENGIDWRIATGFWAVASALAAVAWGVQTVIVERWRRTHRAQLASGDHLPTVTGQIAVQPRIRFALLVRSPLAWGIAWVFGLNSMTTYSMLTVLPGWFVESGQSLTFGTAMVSLTGVVVAIGSFVMPWLVFRIGQPFWLIVICGAALLAGIGGIFFTPDVLPVVSTLLLGLGLCCFPIALSLMNARSRTPAGAAGLAGFGQGIGYLLAAAATLGIGVARAAVPDWWVPFAIYALTVPVSIGFGWLATRPHMIEDELPGAAGGPSGGGASGARGAVRA